MEKMNLPLSIIVPVYNGENHVIRCLNSIKNQSFLDFEVLIIDDGSKDQTYKICAEYIKGDDRFKLHRIDNSGVSIARNLGIDNSIGKYLMFLDSDDFLHPKTFEILMNCSIKSDYIAFPLKRVIDTNRTFIDIESFEQKTIKSNKLYKAIVKDNNIGGYVCNKVFKHEIISRYDLRFNRNVHVSEDLLFTLEYTSYVSKLLFIDIELYYYVFHDDNNSKKLNEKKVKLIEVYDYILKKKYIKFSIVTKMYYLFYFLKQTISLNMQLIELKNKQLNNIFIKTLRKIKVSNFFVFTYKFVVKINYFCPYPMYFLWKFARRKNEKVQ